MEVRFFGEFEVARAGVPIPVRGAKQRALLAVLALHRGSPVRADRLIDQLWGDGQTAKPANALQAQIAQLRRTLGASSIVTSEAGYALDIGAGDLDAARFEDLVTEGRRLSAEGELARTSAVLGDALRLRRGEPLAEFAYAGFADAERAHLNELALVATECRVEADLGMGHHNELVGELEALCRDHPLRERPWELFMLALYRAGRQAEALRAYTDIRDRLVDELGVDPGSGFRELETRILAHDPSLQAAPPSAPRAPELPAGKRSGPAARPTGTVTVLFTDVEGSSRQWEADASAAEALVTAHDQLVRTVVEGHDGYVFATMGDGFGVAFQRASDAVAAAVELQGSFTSQEWAANGLRVRMGVHTGETVERDGDYFGPTVNRTARIMGLAHGGQILLSAATLSLAQGFDTMELGEYQLRGLARPERLHQLVKPGLERDFPPLRGDPGTAHNLPAALTSFVGRQAEIDALVAQVSERRLVTLVGPGRAGKTRLAIEAGRRLLDHFPDGVWLAELAALRDSAQVASTVAQAMGHHDLLAEAGGPVLGRDRLAAAIGSQRVLLVLGNCEHMVAAAGELVGGLLGLCPRLAVVATSRQPLGVPGEQLVEVASPPVPGNLPEPLSSFLGRDAELAQLGQAIGSSRLVTLIGPGGVGKTRLAVEAAARRREQHPGGAWLIELAGVTDPEGVAPAVAATMGAFGPAPSDAQPAGSTAELIARHLAGRSLVIVVDNCEHVIDAAAALVVTLVAKAPGLRLVATSREPLGLPGEILVPIAGLAPTAAAQLFVDRARAVQPGFEGGGPAEEIIDGICRRLDGLPLAIELAAARLRALPLSTLAERLDDRFTLLTRGARTALPRQQTLRAVVDWSYNLLFEDERRLFARLSVFVGGCDLDAVEAVCADDEVSATDVLDVVSRLVDKSLVTAPTAGEVRYAQLQTLWQYGTDRLDDSDEADLIRSRHAAYYRRLAENANERLRGAAAPAWRDRLTPELANLKTALDWHLAAGDTDAALSMASEMAWLWFVNSDFAEGARWLACALGAGGARRPDLHAKAQAWHGYCVGMWASPAAGAVECEEAIDALRAGDDRVSLAEALLLQASVLVRAHQFSRSLEALAEAHALLDPDQHGWLLGAHDMLLTWNLASFGRLDEAETAARSSIERFDAAGEVLLVVNSLNALAGVAAVKGDLAGASIAYEAVLERCRATPQHPYLNLALVALAAVRARQGDDAAADDLYKEAIACSFNPWLSADATVGQAAVARRLGDLARARALLDGAAVRYRDAGLPAGQPRVLAGLAWWALGAGQPDAAVLFAADAVAAAGPIGDRETQLLADSALVAVKAIADPTGPNAERLVALVRQRTQGPSHRALTDEPDLLDLAARLTGAAT